MADLLPLPTAALEDWRYVRTEALATALDAPATVDPGWIRSFVTEGPSFAVVDGAFHHLGRADWPGGWPLSLPGDAEAARWAALSAATSELPLQWAVAGGCRQVLRVTRTEPQVLTVLNAATGGASGWTLRLELAPGSHLHVRLRHAAQGQARSAFRLEAVLGRGAHLRIDEDQATPWAILLPQGDIRVEADAQLTWTSAFIGGALVRQRLDVTLAAPGAAADYASLLDTTAATQAHVLTRLHHAAPQTTSRQLIKTVVDGTSRVSTDGLIAVATGAIGADADFQNRNLILSPTGRADTRPQLDIKTDAVKAAHGATIGRLDADELLYLRQRGFSEAAATTLLARGWRDEVLQRFSA